MDFHPIDSRLGDRMRARHRPLPFLDLLPVPHQRDVRRGWKFDLQCDTVRDGNLLAHNGLRLASLRVEAESARRCDQVESHEAASEAEGFENQSTVHIEIAAQRTWNQQVRVQRAEVEVVWEDRLFDWAEAVMQGVRVRTAESGHASAVGEQFIPLLQGRQVGAV